MRRPEPSGTGDACGGLVTLRGAVSRVARQLAEAGIQDAAQEARRLVAQAAGVDAVDLVARGGLELAAGQRERIAEFTQRRSRHEPLSRIAGRREFYGRAFSLSAGTLDPRADTEAVVDLALSLVEARHGRGAELRILDIGTGSGVLLLTLLAELPGATGVGTDISADALATAEANARALGLGERASFVEHDARAGFEGLAGPFDIVVANPPYIPTPELAGLQPEVRLYDPVEALDGGTDGLDFYRILASSRLPVARQAWIVVEVGAGQSEDVERLFAAGPPVRLTTTSRDLGGHIRAVAAWQQSSQVSE